MNQHDPPPSSPRNDPPSPAAQFNQRFVMIVGVLLLMIIALLAGLWLRERVRAARAELNLRGLADRNARLEATVGQLLLGKLPLRIDRDGLGTQKLRLDGREIAALRLPANLAETIGFKPGDVIIVEKPPPTTATAPATRPSQ